jgi:hypothetical protein
VQGPDVGVAVVLAEYRREVEADEEAEGKLGGGINPLGFLFQVLEKICR